MGHAITKQYDLNGYLGLVEQHRSRETGTLISVYNTEQAGMGTVANGDLPWTLVCEADAWTLGVDSLSLARRHMHNPMGWCEKCNGQVCRRCNQSVTAGWCECEEGPTPARTAEPTPTPEEPRRITSLADLARTPLPCDPRIQGLGGRPYDAAAPGALRLPEVGDLMAGLAEVVEQYMTSAPQVARWADELYMRVGDKWEDVTLEDLIFANRLRHAEDNAWMEPALAANTILRLLDRQGKDTTGFYA